MRSQRSWQTKAIFSIKNEATSVSDETNKDNICKCMDERKV